MQDRTKARTSKTPPLLLLLGGGGGLSHEASEQHGRRVGRLKQKETGGGERKKKSDTAAADNNKRITRPREQPPIYSLWEAFSGPYLSSSISPSPTRIHQIPSVRAPAFLDLSSLSTLVGPLLNNTRSLVIRVHLRPLHLNSTHRGQPCRQSRDHRILDPWRLPHRTHQAHNMNFGTLSCGISTVKWRAPSKTITRSHFATAVLSATSTHGRASFSPLSLPTAT